MSRTGYGKQDKASALSRGLSLQCCNNPIKNIKTHSCSLKKFSKAVFSSDLATTSNRHMHKGLGDGLGLFTQEQTNLVSFKWLSHGLGTIIIIFNDLV